MPDPAQILVFVTGIDRLFEVDRVWLGERLREEGYPARLQQSSPIAGSGMFEDLMNDEIRPGIRLDDEAPTVFAVPYNNGFIFVAAPFGGCPAHPEGVHRSVVHVAVELGEIPASLREAHDAEGDVLPSYHEAVKWIGHLMQIFRGSFLMDARMREEDAAEEAGAALVPRTSRTAWDHVMEKPSTPLRVWSLDGVLYDLVIAESAQEAFKIVDAIHGEGSTAGASAEPHDPSDSITLHWGEEYDSEWDVEASDWPRDEDNEMEPVTRTAQEWVDQLGKGMLAIEGGGCTGPSGIHYRSSWKESRTAP